ncbi:major capsid family protein [Flavonifractor plautii]|uniref:major capsid family protein n=1 Tax=Flavonifractor plautii TaxID=292800 RepID=UPI001FAC3F76|nr:major capsid family protein [Flavonifractor plautii]
MSFQNVGTYNAGVFTPKAAGPAPVGGVPVMDADGIASGGAFLVSELEKRDPLIRKPLTSFTYPRDIVIQTGGGWVDYVSAMSVAYGITGGAVNSPVTAGGANGIPVVQASVDKGVYKAHVFAAALRVMFQDMQRANYIGRSLDNLLQDGVRMAYDKHMDGNCALYNMIAYMIASLLIITAFPHKMLHKNKGFRRVAHIWRTRPLKMVVSAW